MTINIPTINIPAAIQLGPEHSNQINRILNRYERKTLALLQKSATRFKMSVWTKCRIADVLPITNSGLSNALYSYALKSHLDFIITFDFKPVIVVEFDGPGHVTARSRTNDAYKNQICDHFNLPLLRVDTQYLRFIGDSTILEFIVESVLEQIQIDTTSQVPMFSFSERASQPEVSELFLPYDVTHISLNPKAYLDAMFAIQHRKTGESRLLNWRTLQAPTDLYVATRLAKTSDSFYTAAALVLLDEDTGILGVASVFDNSRLQLDAAFLAVALSLIDALELIRMFDESQYGGIEIRHALEYLAHFKDYANDGDCSRFLSTEPLCGKLTEEWLSGPK